MDLINLALKMKDYEWAKELMKQSEDLDNKKLEFNLDKKMEFNIEESIALEDISTQYAVREKVGLRGFNINSDYDRNSSDLVITEKDSYQKGEKVNFVVPAKEELIFIRGTFSGYLMGLGEAYKILNSQILNHFASKEGQSNTNEGNIRKQVKPRKGKPKPN